MVTVAVVAVTLTSQRRPRPSSTVRRDDDVMLAAKDDAISGVMHCRRRRRRRRYCRVGGGGCDGGGGGDGSDGRRGFSDGRTFLLHVVSVEFVLAVTCLDTRLPRFRYPVCHPLCRYPFSFNRDAKCFDQPWHGERDVAEFQRRLL